MLSPVVSLVDSVSYADDTGCVHLVFLVPSRGWLRTGTATAGADGYVFSVGGVIS